jgi:hypothetical protein
MSLCIDFGRVYYERRRVARAVDGALSAAGNELPSEYVAHERALTYLREYLADRQSWGKTRVVTNAGDSTQVISGPLEVDAVWAIWIDTAFSRDLSANEPINTANRMRLTVREKVPTIFLRWAGVKQISIETSAEVQTFPNQTITVVSDVANSMKFISLCFGCWKENCVYRRCWTLCSVEDATKNCCTEELGSLVLANLDQVQANDITNVVDGMKKGIAASSSETGSLKQSRATHVMILVADKSPNVPPDDEPQGQECWRENLWAGDERRNEKEQRAADCAVYYARKAEANGIFIYTVSLGSHADQDLMAKIASITGGHHRWASTPGELDEILSGFFYSGGSRIAQ